jgi:hypothetical protein
MDRYITCLTKLRLGQTHSKGYTYWCLFIYIKPGIDCGRLPREAMFVALPRKADAMLPPAAERTLLRANLARVESNRSGSSSRGKGISLCCALSVETVLWRKNSVDQQPLAAAALRCWTRARLLKHKQTNEFAADEQLLAAAARNRYLALQCCLFGVRLG